MVKLLFCLLLIVSCVEKESQNIWPKIPSLRDNQIEEKIQEKLSLMSLEEKVGQMIQGEIRWLSKGDVEKFHLGSVLNGGGSWPYGNKFAKIQDWVSMADDFWEESMRGENKIPVIWGVDAVHGHNNVYNATFFPHNIGLGATRDPDLVRRIGEITGKEIRVTGQDWNFSPVVAVVRDDRWGRTYEAFSEDPELVKNLGRAMVEGLNSSPVLACAKHYIGDGGTQDGVNTGNVDISEEELMRIHGQGYISALEAGALSVMASFSSWQGEKMHSHKYLLTDVLKRQMGFDGLVISDWDGIAYVKGCNAGNCPQAVLAGIDMFMITNQWKDFYYNLIDQVKKKIVPIERIDDAVTRILRVKYKIGLMDAPKPSERFLSGDLSQLASLEHRLVAREAARKSMVLLKNKNGVLPLDLKKRIVVVGKSADKIQNQMGGWSLSWLGRDHENTDFPNAVSIFKGLKDKGLSVRLDETASNLKDVDVAIAVIGEIPYAETNGDIKTLEHFSRYPEDEKILQKVKDAKIPIVTVFLSGRALYVNKELNLSDAFVAAFLPGGEAGPALAELLFNEHDFSGKLSYSWPKSACQTLNIGDKNYNPLFSYGYGLTYKDQDDLPENLDESSKGCD